MIGIIKADIVHSRRVLQPALWLVPLKKWLAKNIGTSPQSWEITWGDFIQLEISEPQKSIGYAVALKAFLKQLQLPHEGGSKGLDVRISVGVGEKTYTASRISESNGPAFIYAGEAFESLQASRRRLVFKSGWEALDTDLNLALTLASVFMDGWTAASAELVVAVLESPGVRQEDLGHLLGIRQNSVSGRWQRAHLSELLLLLDYAERKLKAHLP